VQTKGDALWKSRTEGLFRRTLEVFFQDGIPIEISCELPDRIQCTTDMLSFKGYLLRWMASTAQIAPFLHDEIKKVIKGATTAAIASCDPAAVCGFRWNTGAYDGLTGAGQQMNVLAALSSLLVDQPGIMAPLTEKTGGTSKGDVDAGGNPNIGSTLAPITTADRAGAGILTIMTLTGMAGTIYWLSSGMNENGKRMW
jgi:mannan endo-1,6-alpha-mannosidase